MKAIGRSLISEQIRSQLNEFPNERRQVYIKYDTFQVKSRVRGKWARCAIKTFANCRLNGVRGT